LPNPGRLAAFINVNGNDKKVINFLKKYEIVNHFLTSIYRIIELAVENYRERNFTDLMIAFGCTGGQHRSVYCANQLANYLKKKFTINIELEHLELEG